MIRALVSIHDVMPSTMQDVTDLLRLCDGHGMEKVTLLVVPGLAWSPAQLDQLRSWQAEGRELAGHGWVHRCSQVSTWTHRLHSLVLSRNVAEHLSVSRSDVMDLVSNCARWFTDNEFVAPELYVPPAWALGRLSRSDLQTLPFKTYETLFRLHFAGDPREYFSPLVGFEADTSLRKFALRISNAVAIQIARTTGRALRIAIHPQDHKLQLTEQLSQVLSKPWQSLLYRELTERNLF
jgi:predicted deacetylase